jgi:hypothetical protein
MDDCSGRVVVPHSDSIHELGDDGEFLHLQRRQWNTRPASTRPWTVLAYVVNASGRIMREALSADLRFAGALVRRHHIDAMWR